MACGGLLKELCEEATCSICLDYFSDPVTIAKCGHNFCRACLSRSCGEAAAEGACPHCRGRAEPKSLRPNLQLANFVEIAKKFALQEGKEGSAKGEDCEKHQQPPELFCVVCGRSQEHRDDQVALLEEAAQQQKTALGARKGRVCQKHQEPLHLFCKDDEALICVVCDRSKGHRHHETLPLEEAFQEYKDQFCRCLEILKKEREKIVAHKGDVETEREKQEWESAMEGLEKQMLEGMQEICDKMGDKMSDKMKNMKDLIQTEVGELRKDIGEIKTELQTSSQKIQEMEQKTQDLGVKMKDLERVNQKVQDQMVMMECKATEKYLRLRGVPELLSENTHKYIVDLLAIFLEEQPDHINYHFDLIYRVNSLYAEQKNLPRDVVVQLLTKRMKEDILRKHYKNPLEIDGKRITIMQELPKKVFQDRTKYRQLTEKLRTKNIRYRWELPEGLSFNFQDRRFSLKTTEQMIRFMFDYQRDFGEEDED